MAASNSQVPLHEESNSANFAQSKLYLLSAPYTHMNKDKAQIMKIQLNNPAP